LGMTFGETAFIASARRTRHSNVTRGERGGRSRGPGGRAAGCIRTRNTHPSVVHARQEVTRGKSAKTKSQKRR
jgi:hypothetical protein